MNYFVWGVLIQIMTHGSWNNVTSDGLLKINSGVTDCFNVTSHSVQI